MPSTWVEPNGRFSQKMLTDDVASIKALYYNNGFLAVKIDPDAGQRLRRQEG